jgi:hypothetical protein
MKNLLREYIQRILLEVIKTPFMSGEIISALNKASKSGESFETKKQGLIETLKKFGFKVLSDPFDLQFKGKESALGSSRLVYGDDDIVIKIAIDENGLKQNNNEAKLAKNAKETLVRLVGAEKEENPMWIAFERVVPMTEEKFKELFGMTHEDFSTYVCNVVRTLRDDPTQISNYFKEILPKKIASSKESGYGKIARLIKRWIEFFVIGDGKDTACGDAMKLASLGFSRYTNNVVTFDYGLSISMRKELERKVEPSPTARVEQGPEIKTTVARRSVKPETTTSAERPRAKFNG